jgi:hypothetical protein
MSVSNAIVVVVGIRATIVILEAIAIFFLTWAPIHVV